MHHTRKQTFNYSKCVPSSRHIVLFVCLSVVCLFVCLSFLEDRVSFNILMLEDSNSEVCGLYNYEQFLYKPMTRS